MCLFVVVVEHQPRYRAHALHELGDVCVSEPPLGGGPALPLGVVSLKMQPLDEVVAQAGDEGVEVVR